MSNMAGSTRRLVLRSNCAHGLWNVFRSNSQKGLSSQTGNISSQGPTYAARRHGFRVSKDFPSGDSLLHPTGSCHRAYFSASEVAYAASSPASKSLGLLSLAGGSAVLTYIFYPKPTEESTSKVDEDEDDVHTLANWSNTHQVTTKFYLEPESLEELERMVRNAHEQKQKLRPVGSGLSPNGIGFGSGGMVNVALMDEILNVDKETGRVTVQAGARVEQVVEGLKPHGLTMENYASIKQQQIGGLIQVGAHGTGIMIPPMDEHVKGLKLVTPAKGTLELTPESDPELFYLARCGLGALGVVAEVTLQCVPRHRLLEHTFVTNMEGVKKNHKKWLTQNKHHRYLWIPDTDAVVVVQSNPLTEGEAVPKVKEVADDEKLRPVRQLYKESAADYRLRGPSESTSDDKGAPGDDRKQVHSDAQILEMSFTELRDALIALDPLNRQHIVRVNRAEAEYWKLNEGYKTGWIDELLGFDCGGEQWVSEVSFPAGTAQSPDMADVKYMEDLLKLIEKEEIPAPSPIEQRWSAGSRSPLSPAFSPSLDALYAWVGIIMYLPTSEGKERTAITKRFLDYRKAGQRNLWDAYNAHEHWAKMEVPTDEESLRWCQERLRRRFPVEAFRRWRAELDPHSILSNEHLEKFFPQYK